MLKQADKFLNDDLLLIENHILKPTKRKVLTDGIASDLFYLNLRNELTARFTKQAHRAPSFVIFKSYCPLWLKL
jgi:hypothetical protein